MMNHTILCVDDEIDNVEALERLFRKKYKVLKATSGAKALELLAQDPDSVAVILTDQRMPQMTGSEMLEKSVALAPKASRLLLTGYTDLDSVIEAVNKGQIHRYLTKPWDPIDLQQTVSQAVEKFELGQTLEKKNRELEQALNELKTLDAAKTQFMLLINHELKTPLTSLLNFLHLLKETPINEEQTQYIQRVEKSADRLKFLIEDVLLLMRSETGQLRLKNTEIRWSQIIQEIPATLQEQLQKKKQKIAFKSDIETVHFDPFIAHEIVNRLIDNASKFGSPGSNIDFVLSKAGDSFQIEILNRGSQFDLNKTSKLTQPFFLDENILHHSIGTGLGLSICQALLKNYKSKLEFENRSTDEALVRFTVTETE
jgi:two-component system sensor histidine kinase/response regulator